MGRRAWRRAAVLGVVALFVAGAAGCKPEVTKEVLFVNDSVTNQAVEHIVTELNMVERDSTASRYAPNFGSSVPGIGLLRVPGFEEDEVAAYWSAHLTSVLAHVDPEVIVVELGYNDCGVDVSAYGEAIDGFMTVVPTDTPVHWLTMQDVDDQVTCDEPVNAALEEATTRWPNLSLLDFAAHMEGHPEWVVDGRHLSEEGKLAYADWLHAELDARYGDTEPEPN
jgi:hypothetical protein